MSKKNKNYSFFKYRNTYFSIRFAIFIIFFSILLSWLIYWRETTSGFYVSFLKCMMWQIFIWIPWLIFYWLIKKTKTQITKLNKGKQNLILGSLYLFILIIHWLWFVKLSTNYSPFIGAPNENYGVFPYFFIFWSLIDLIFLIVIINNLIEKKERKHHKEYTLNVKRGVTTVLLKSKNIYWLSADGYYVNIHSDQGKFLLRRTLKNLLDTLPKSDFIRIHRSAIINYHFIVELKTTQKKGYTVLMKDGESHSVSKTYIKNLKELLRENSL